MHSHPKTNRPSDRPFDAESTSLRLVTYNIHKGIGGVDRRYRIRRIIQVLERMRPDLLFLQEVDEGAPRSRRERQVDVIGDALGFRERVYVPNVTLKEGHYGNAILAREHFDYEENVDLTLRWKKRRSALHARLTTQGVRLWLFNVHLGLAEFERRRQLERVLRYQVQHHCPRDAAVIVAGDFNDVWGSLGPKVLTPAGYRTTRKPAATFPAVRPLRCLDRVFVRGPIQLRRCSRSRMKLAQAASDHLPVLATMDLADR